MRVCTAKDFKAALRIFKIKMILVNGGYTMSSGLSLIYPLLIQVGNNCQINSQMTKADCFARIFFFFLTDVRIEKGDFVHLSVRETRESCDLNYSAL